MRRLFVWITGAPDTLYEGERFLLRFRFDESFPMQAPEVVFVAPHMPVHEHVYTNGHICLSILYNDWTPSLAVDRVCISILSMLSSAKTKQHPPDNNRYVASVSLFGAVSPKKMSWEFHDTKC